ncbi:MAG: 2-C-methyl-D-erythritol 4-phosphate cytidylyltransferase [Chitinivibrionales bacterium]|nr:2-C-methyl-D-erythritol 4-phosphate cytidylyltransferase [Chitinivibrionales bacterium]
MENTEAVIVAAGAGARLGGLTPKAFVPLAGKPLFAHSLAAFDAHPAVRQIVLVVPPQHQDYARNFVNACTWRVPVKIVVGGRHRHQSVYNGVAATGNDCFWVMVHDGARPFVSQEIIDALLDKGDSWACAVTAVPETDTIRYFSGMQVLDTIDRGKVVRIGTPQLFNKDLLLKAFGFAETLPQPPTDEAELMKSAGHIVGLAWGDPLNFKITAPADLELAEAICARRNALRLGG